MKAGQLSRARARRLEMIERYFGSYRLPLGVFQLLFPHVSKQMLKLDLRMLDRSFRSTPPHDYAGVFRMYARWYALEQRWERNQLPPDEVRLAVARWLNIEELRSTVGTVLEHLDRFRRPAIQPGQEPFLRLLEDCYRLRDPDRLEDVYADYLVGVYNGRVPAPTKNSAAIGGCLAVYTADFRHAIQPVWTAEATADVWSVLEQLSDDDRAILVRSYGLDGQPPESLAEQARRRQLSRSRLQQRLGSTRHWLRHPLRADVLQPYVTPLPAILRRAQRVQSLAAREVAPGLEFMNALYYPVNRLELSVRSSNTLRAMELRLLGELAEKTEGQMLKVRNFGQRSLAELRRVLHEHDLQFGMQLPAHWRDFIPPRP